MSSSEITSQPTAIQRPSLLGNADDANSFDGGNKVQRITPPPGGVSMRMLDAIDHSASKQRPAVAVPHPWGLLTALACMAAVLTMFAVWLLHRNATQAQAPLASVKEAMQPSPPAAPNPTTSVALLEPPVKPAAQAVTSEPSAVAATTANDSIASPPSQKKQPFAKRTTNADTAKAKLKSTTQTDQDRPTTTQKSKPLDPDAEIVAAIMANMDRRPTKTHDNVAINAMAKRCLEKADAIDGLLCRQRICAKHWGKVAACPKELGSPKASAR